MTLLYTAEHVCIVCSIKAAGLRQHPYGGGWRCGADTDCGRWSAWRNRPGWQVER